MRYLFSFLLFLISFSTVTAQTVEEAVRLSNTNAGATARVLGIGGAFTSLGADFASNYINPAGIGMYRSSEYSLSPGFQFHNSKSSYLGNTENATKNNFNIGQFGMVISRPRRGESKLRAVNYGIGVNRTNNFNTTQYYEAFNRDNSIADFFIEDANGNTVSEINANQGSYANLALSTGIIRPVGTNPTLYNSTLNFAEDTTGNNLGLQQSESITSERAFDSFNLSIGANIEDKLFIGGSIGVPNYRFTKEFDYYERDTEQNVPQLTELNLYIRETTDGSGLNLSLGAIYRATQNIRVGLSIQSPSYLAFESNFQLLLASVIEDYPNEGEVSEFSQTPGEGSLLYAVTTPMRFNLGASYLNAKGFVSADVEYIPHQSTEYFIEDNGIQAIIDYQNDLNNQIKDELSATINLRLGGEYVLNKYRLRAGYALQQSPTEITSTKQTISIGGGYRGGTAFVDLAGLLSLSNETYLPYPLSSETVSNVTFNNTAISIISTFGVKF